MDTYTVTALDGAPGSGVRCVKWSDGSQTRRQVPAFAWYGEGNWQGNTYRHVGQAFVGKGRPNQYQGFASDVYGNGEAYQGNFPGNLVMTVYGKDTIVVEGAWSEKWSRVTSVAYQPLPVPMTCGSLFEEYQASDVNAYLDNERDQAVVRSGSGVRCLLKVGRTGTTWFGAGHWDGKAYAHLATGSSKGYGASDFCANNGDYCGNFRYGAIRKQYSSVHRAPVIHGWNEVWEKTALRQR